MSEIDIKMMLGESHDFQSGVERLKTVASNHLTEDLKIEVFNLVDLSADSRNISLWFSYVLKKYRMPVELKTIWLLLCEPSGFDLEIRGYSLEFKSSIKSSSKCYSPKPDHLARSRALRDLYNISQLNDDDAHYCVQTSITLAYACLAARQAIRFVSKSIRESKSSVSVVVGWEDGEPINVGKLGIGK